MSPTVASCRLNAVFAALPIPASLLLHIVIGWLLTSSPLSSRLAPEMSDSDLIPVVDTHVHVAGADRERYPVVQKEGAEKHWVMQRPQTMEQLLAYMDAS